MTDHKAAAFVGLCEALSRNAGQDAYVLVERGPDGRISAEDFPAPDDDSALERARDVSLDAGELWRAGELVARWPAKRVR